MCDVCSLHALLVVFLQPLALFPLSIPTYHNLRLNPWRSWVCYEYHVLGETVQMFVSDSSHPAVFIFSLSPIPLCNAVWLFWGLVLTGDTACGQGSQPLPASQICDWHWCKDPVSRGTGPENSLLITSYNSVSDFSGQSCSSQTRVSPQFFSFPACSHLCFITAIQPDHSAHLSIASSHLDNPSHSNRDSSS